MLVIAEINDVDRRGSVLGGIQFDLVLLLVPKIKQR
jgi:hypothetical protein